MHISQHQREHNDKSNNITREEIHLSAVYVYDECLLLFCGDGRTRTLISATTHIGLSIVGGYVDVCPKVTWRKGRHFSELIFEKKKINVFFQNRQIIVLYSVAGQKSSQHNKSLTNFFALLFIILRRTRQANRWRD